MGKEMELLEHESQGLVAQVRKLIIIQLLNGNSIEPVAATGRSIQAAKDVHRRALAGAARPHDRQIIAAVNDEIKLIKRSDFKITLAVDLADATQFSNSLGG